jgi:hypothetical protein
MQQHEQVWGGPKDNYMLTPSASNVDQLMHVRIPLTVYAGAQRQSSHQQLSLPEHFANLQLLAAMLGVQLDSGLATFWNFDPGQYLL